MKKDPKRTTRGGQNESPLGHIEGWRFMDPNDPRRETWLQLSNVEITPNELPGKVSIDFYKRLREAGICDRYRDQPGERVYRTWPDSWTIESYWDHNGTMLDDQATWLLLNFVSHIVEAADVKEAVVSTSMLFTIFRPLTGLPSEVPSNVFLCLLLEGVSESLGYNIFVAQTLEDQVRAFCASSLDEREIQALRPFLEFLSQTETGKKVQAELRGISIQEAEILLNPDVADLFDRMEKAGYCTKEGNLYRWEKSIALWGYMVDEVSDCFKLRPSNDTIPWERFAPAFTNISQPQTKTARETVSKYSERKGKLTIFNKPEGWEDLEKVIYT